MASSFVEGLLPGVSLLVVPSPPPWPPASPPISPPPMVPDLLAAVECSSSVVECGVYEVPTDWWSEDDRSLFYAFLIDGAGGLLTLLLFLLLTQSPYLRRRVFNARPQSDTDVLTEGWRHIPFSTVCSAQFEGGVHGLTLEDTMLLRYISFNLRLRPPVRRGRGGGAKAALRLLDAPRPC